MKPDFAIQLDLFLDNAIRGEVHRGEQQSKPVSAPRHVQLELF